MGILIRINLIKVRPAAHPRTVYKKTNKEIENGTLPCVHEES